MIATLAALAPRPAARARLGGAIPVTDVRRGVARRRGGDGRSSPAPALPTGGPGGPVRSPAAARAPAADGRPAP